VGTTAHQEGKRYIKNEGGLREKKVHCEERWEEVTKRASYGISSKGVEKRNQITGIPR